MDFDLSTSIRMQISNLFRLTLIYNRVKQNYRRISIYFYKSH